MHNLLKDRGAPLFLVRQFGLDRLLTLAVFTVWDWFLTLVGRGAIMNVVLRKPAHA